MKSTCTIALLVVGSLASAGEWRQAAGPNGNFVVDGEAPSEFSVTHGRNVLWRTPLPSTGQGAVIVANGRCFVTSHEPVTADTEFGSTILGLCFDAESGKERWRREIPGTRETDLSSLFSDNTASSPVATDDRVCFSNVGGTTSCFDHDGREQWSATWTPFGRHHARQHEPILDRGRVILVHVPRDDLPQSATTKAGAKPLGRGRDVWTYLQAYDLANGEKVWTAEPATTVHSTSQMGRLPDGRRAILTGRGGAHQPPEEPHGVSMLSADDGSRIWDLEVKGYPCAQNACWNDDVACVFVGKEHRTIDVRTGETRDVVSLVEDVTVRRFVDGKYVTRNGQSLPKLKKAITRQSNCLVGHYHYFRAHDDVLIGRVNVHTGEVEYLQVPVQVVRRSGKPDEIAWTKALPNDMKNADGFVVTSDRRNAGSGWGHVSAASPTVVGDLIYMPTMIGMVYVLKWNAPVLDESALASISDLGPATETWSLSSLSYADGRLYARTLKEMICIGDAETSRTGE